MANPQKTKALFKNLLMTRTSANKHNKETNNSNSVPDIASPSFLSIKKYPTFSSNDLVYQIFIEKRTLFLPVEVDKESSLIIFNPILSPDFDHSIIF